MWYLAVLLLFPMAIYLGIRWIFYSDFSLQIILMRAAVLGVLPFVAIELFILVESFFLYDGFCYAWDGVGKWKCRFADYLQHKLLFGAFLALMFNTCWTIILSILLAIKYAVFIKKRPTPSPDL